MSKIGDIRLQLDEQAEALGFESLEQAQQAGCEIDWDKPELIEPLEAAHRAWVEEKTEVLEELKSVYNDIDVPVDGKVAIKKAIKFIEEAHE